MNHDEIVDLLTAISAYDKRKPDRAAILAWGKSSELGRWTLTEALDAVHGHFSEDPAYLMPAHVTARIKAVRQDRALRDEQRALEAGPVDQAAADRVAAVVAELASTLGWEGKRDAVGTALRVACPHCSAPVGQRCVATSTGKSLTQSACHPSRADALAEQIRGRAS